VQKGNKNCVMATKHQIVVSTILYLSLLFVWIPCICFELLSLISELEHGTVQKVYVLDIESAI
jgi:hypothetical protein